MADYKKLSVIIPNYNNEEYLDKSLESLINQSYSNLEIILINDGSKGNCDEIANKYKDKIKYIKHDKNKGIFQTRLTGYNSATGDYIAFLDADDYVSVDYYRTMMEKAIETDSDIVINNFILQYDDGSQKIFNLMQQPLKELNDKECFKNYMEQMGLNYSWSILPNKIYKKTLWDKAFPYYKNMEKRLVMTEDIAFSTVLFYFAKRVNKIHNDVYYYCQHEKSSTASKGIKYEKMISNIEDIITSFGFIEKFLKDVDAYEEYKEKFLLWKSLYYKIYIEIAKDMQITGEQQAKIKEKLEEYCPIHTDIEDRGYFYSIVSDWDNRLEKIKLAICNKTVKYVYFEIFDTLINIPFWSKSDFFKILEEQFKTKLNSKNIFNFAVIRETSEILLRNMKKSTNATLDELYDFINKEYKIEKELLQKIKEKETYMIKMFSYKRKTAFELYRLAIAMGKTVIGYSNDCYNENLLKEILQKNGYLNIQIKKDPEVLTNGIETVYVGKEKVNGCNFMEFPKAIDKFKNIPLNKEILNQISNSKEDLVSVRCMLTIVANKYFDNPYISFNKETNFNGDPFFIGYYAVGMYTFGLVKMMLDKLQNSNYNDIIFIFNNSYLLMKIYELMVKYYIKFPAVKTKYLNKEELKILNIQSKIDFYRIVKKINVLDYTPIEVLERIKDYLEYDQEEISNLCKLNNININDKFNNVDTFNKFITIVIKHFYKEEEHVKKLENIKVQLNKMCKKDILIFDIKSNENIWNDIVRLINIPIDIYCGNINNYQKWTSKYVSERLLAEKEPEITNYSYNYALTTIQDAAKEFIIDILNLFNVNKELICCDMNYTSLPFKEYLKFYKWLDRLPILQITVDEYREIGESYKTTVSYNNESDEEIIKKLFNIDEYIENYVEDTDLMYNAKIDLKDRNKFVRLIYYILFDKNTLKRRITEIKNKFKSK